MEKLPNAPLQEVILDIRWELVFDPQSRAMADPQYEFALGRFQSLVKDLFPHTVNKIPSAVPGNVLPPYTTRHQFWQGNQSWPVTQLGPGILTLNDTEANYQWEKAFFPMAQQVVAHLETAYQTELPFLEYSLRYVDVVRMKDYPANSIEAFVKQHFNFSFENNFTTRGRLNNFKFNQSFELADQSSLQLAFDTGLNQQKEEIFMWQTMVNRKKPVNRQELVDWMDSAHQVTSEVFKDLCKPEFYDSFKHHE